ncbi:hypothetical protein OSTOST_15311 [Ostertagia ostertagi]
MRAHDSFAAAVNILALREKLRIHIFTLIKTLRGVIWRSVMSNWKHLAELYFGIKIATQKKELDRTSRISEVTSETNDTVIGAEASIEEINQVEGVAEYLFQGDINLTE